MLHVVFLSSTLLITLCLLCVFGSGFAMGCFVSTAFGNKLANIYKQTTISPPAKLHLNGPIMARD